MTREAFEQLVEDALREIPRRFRKAVRNVAVMVEDEPSPELLRQLGIGRGGTLLGLYHGTPLPERSWDYGNTLPDRISIYQRPIEYASGGDEDKTRECVIETVIHEFGHYFGLNEAEIRAIEDQYWHGESVDRP
ncbi:MAG TPA: metallopeptidase family protein [Vicinamibacterales bacterium]|jgi:predicted Zn-dependent protease with MMP-like domain